MGGSTFARRTRPARYERREVESSQPTCAEPLQQMKEWGQVLRVLSRFPEAYRALVEALRETEAMEEGLGP